MPLYHIELRTAQKVWETVDIDRPDQTMLRREVAKFVGELLKDHADQIWNDTEWQVDVTDDSGLILYVMHLMVTNSASSAPMRR